MKKLLLLAVAAMTAVGAMAQKRVVKFSVDMNGQTVSTNGVHVAGNFQGWSPSTSALTQEGSTDIYSAYFECDEKSVVEYKFINGNDWGSTEGVPAIAQKGHKNNGESNDNRWFWTGSGSDTLTLPAFQFGKAAPAGQYAVRFAVDLAKEASVSSNGVHIAGNLQGWDPSKSQMANLYSSNKVHEIIFCLADGTYAFKYVNGNAWGSDEAVPSSCAVNNNREISVSGADVELSKVCYGSCDACPSRAIPQYNVTFQVDMAAECDFDEVDIAGGKINGWSGGDKLTKGSGSVWAITIKLDSGVEIAHKFRKLKKGVVNWEGGSDRKIFAHSDTTLAARCFGKDVPCSGTPVAPSDITFKVDLTNEIASDTVWVMGNFTTPAWQSGAIALTQTSGSTNFYEATVKGVCPESFEYKFANEKMTPNTNGETFTLDTNDRSCLVSNGLGSFNRTYTRTSGNAVTLFYGYNLCQAGGTLDVADLNTEVRLAPVPASGMFNVTLSGSKVSKVNVLSLDGRVVRSLSANEASVNVEVAGLTGVYFVSIQDNLGRTAIKKIVLQ
jgi:hypothetical protein